MAKDELLYQGALYTNAQGKVVDQGHYSPDGNYYQCRPVPNESIELPNIDTAENEPVSQSEGGDAGDHEGLQLIGIPCGMVCALFAMDGTTPICGHSGRPLVPVKEE